jgi:hypothetical protein
MTYYAPTIIGALVFNISNNQTEKDDKWSEPRLGHFNKKGL